MHVQRVTPGLTLVVCCVCASSQTAEGVRVRCLEAQELVAHLHAFSCHSAGADFSKLPALFTNDATLAEAAVRVGGGLLAGWLLCATATGGAVPAALPSMHSALTHLARPRTALQCRL